MKYYAKDDNWNRVLPSLKCPLCGNELKELRHRSAYETEWTLSWACDCDGLNKLKQSIDENIPKGLGRFQNYARV